MSSCSGPAGGQGLCNKQATHRGRAWRAGKKGFPEGSPLRLQLSDPQSFGVAASKKLLIINNNKYPLFLPAFKHRSRCLNGGDTSQVGGRLLPHLSRKISPFPGERGRSRVKKPICLGQGRSAGHTPAPPAPSRCRQRCAGAEGSVFSPRQGPGRSLLWTWGQASPARPFRPPLLAQSSRFVRRIKADIYIYKCKHTKGTRERGAAHPEGTNGAAASPHSPNLRGAPLCHRRSPRQIPPGSQKPPSTPLPATASATPRPIATASDTAIYSGKGWLHPNPKVPAHPIPPQPHAYLDTRAPWAALAPRWLRGAQVWLPRLRLCRGWVGSRTPSSSQAAPCKRCGEAAPFPGPLPSLGGERRPPPPRRYPGAGPPRRLRRMGGGGSPHSPRLEGGREGPCCKGGLCFPKLPPAPNFPSSPKIFFASPSLSPQKKRGCGRVSRPPNCECFEGQLEGCPP